MSFLWTVALEADAPGLERGDPPEGLLSAEEHDKLATLKFEQRRRKWLLGRFAAKRVLRVLLASERGAAPAPDEITIANDPEGAPFAILPGGELCPFCLSISHRAGVALAVVAREPGVRLGADLETVAPRDPALVADFFTPLEQELVARAAAGDARDRLVARIWSAKESVLKALGVGLRLDTRSIEIAGEGGAPWPGAPEGFRALDVRRAPNDARVVALTRDEGHFVHTVARLEPRP